MTPNNSQIFIVDDSSFFTSTQANNNLENMLKNAKTLYAYVSRMMAHYLPWDVDFRLVANTRTYIATTNSNSPFYKILEYSDLIREEGRININYKRLGLIPCVEQTIEMVRKNKNYKNVKIDEFREIFPVKKANFSHKHPAIVVFGSASSGDDSCIPIGNIIGRHKLICIVGGNGIKENNAMKLIAMSAHDSGSPKVDMITTGYLYHAQGARLTGDTTVHVASTMHERMDLFWLHGSIFLAVRGGLGAIMELLFIIQRNIKNKINNKNTKPIIILNYKGFWDTFVEILDDLGLKSQLIVVNTVKEFNTKIVNFSSFK